MRRRRSAPRSDSEDPPLTLRRPALASLALLAQLGCLVAAGRGAEPAADLAVWSAPPELTRTLAHDVESARQVARAVGVHVVDLAAKSEVYGFEADQPRILASNTKLLTTAAALAELGPDFRFETRFLLRGEVRDGVLAGDVAVVAGADPNLSGRFHDGDSFAPFRPWAQALRARGISRVAGELVLVNGLFEHPRIHPEWPRDQLSAWYEAPVDALAFNDDCVLVRIRPGGAAGARVRVETVPKLSYFEIRNSARTQASGRGRLVVSRLGDSDTLVVSGSMGLRSGPVEVWVAVHDPEAYFAAALRAAFAEEGVAIGGADRFAGRPLEPGWQEVAVHASDLARTIQVTNKRSQNFYAETLAKYLGWRSAGSGSWETGVAAISRFLVGIGLEPGSFQLADGSGLARSDRATPRAVTELLETMYFHPYGREYLQSLPYSGEEELSWKRRLATPPYRGNVFAKTGTLNGVSTLSGYAKAASGRVYAFSILLNQVRSNYAAHAAQDRIVKTLVDRG